MNGNRVIALIPARSGSQRIPNKNILDFGGFPLLAYSIQAAKDSGIFDEIYVSSDSYDICKIGVQYGAVGIYTPLEYAHKDTDADIKWVRYAIQAFPCDVFSILRPTSPFRTGKTIQRAWDVFNSIACDSLRAVELVKQNPYKMWTLDGDYIRPLLMPETPPNRHFHSKPTQSAPKVYIQNASLEIAHSYCVTEYDSISGYRVVPFFTNSTEGLDINDWDEWDYAVKLLESKGIYNIEMPKPCKV